MEIYIVYESVSVIMLLITMFFYSYKNWLPLRKNSIYMRMLVIGVVMMAIDLILGAFSLAFVQYEDILQKISGIFMNIGFPILGVHLFLYDVAIAKSMRVTKTTGFHVALCAEAVMIFLSVIAIVADVPFVFIGHGDYPYGAGNILQILFLLLCFGAGTGYVIAGRNKIKKREFWILTVTNLVLFLGVIIQTCLKARAFGSYYVITIVLILYYLALHNSDQYRFRSSKCFSHAGYNKVLREKALYRENFVCLGICINNIESITNYCTEQEIAQLHRRLGEILRYYCGRHNTYNIHSFEYMAILKGTDNVDKLHRKLADGIPPYIRLHNKNVSISCDFYAVEFADARYDARDFNRILISMRKLAMATMNRYQLLKYQGDKQTEIQDDLEAMRILSDRIVKRKFHYQMLPIQSLTDIDKTSYEMILCENMENGDIVSQERIWELAVETGYGKEVGYIACEMLCDYIKEKGILHNSQVERAHLNLIPSQLASPEIAKGYTEILAQKGVSPEKVCFEITIDENVDYQILTESIMVLKEYGIHLMLDQFGVCACNLKNALNIPFDAVKLNNYMVSIYCDGKSRQLVYLINMLHSKDWAIYLDGVDRLEQIEILSELKVSGIQGQALLLNSFHEKIEKCFQGMGGDLIE